MKPYLRNLAALFALLLASGSATAQTTAHVEFPLYKNYIVSTGDNVNLRRQPSTQSARLMNDMVDIEGIPQSDFYWSNEKHIKRGDVEVVQASIGDVFPNLGKSGDWYKTIRHELNHVVPDCESVAYISAKFSTPAKLQKLTTDALPTLYWIPDFTQDRQLIHRETGKFKDLYFTAYLTMFEGIVEVNVLVPFYVSDTHWLIVTEPLRVAGKGPSKSGLFRWTREENIFSGLPEDVTYLYIGALGSEEDKYTEKFNKAVDILLTCSDSDFEQLVRRSLVGSVSKSQYQVMFCVDYENMPPVGGGQELPNVYTVDHYTEAPGATQVVMNLDFKDNRHKIIRGR